MQHPAVASDSPHQDHWPRGSMLSVDASIANVLLASSSEPLHNKVSNALINGLSCSYNAAQTAQQTLQKLHEQQYDLLILDLQMTDQHGLELLRIVQATHPHTRIILLCSFAQPRLARLMLRTGAQGYVDQYPDESEFTAAVRTVLSGRRYLSDRLCESFNTNKLSEVERTSVLSTLERQVFGRMLMGCTLRTLAVDLELNEPVASACQARVMKKMAGQMDAGIAPR
jgi:DNA-binding NarL/FixJ family response regulator